MKQLTISIVLVLSSAVASGQFIEDSRIPLLGEQAPSFTAASTNGTINFPEDYGRNWKLLVSHPKDFTPVCTSELLELARMQDEFKEMGVDIVAVSTDTLFLHESWKQALEDISRMQNDPVEVKFPLVDDQGKRISAKYGMLHESTNTTRYVRGVYIIDPENYVRFTQFYPVEVGRSMQELKRAVIALQTAERHDVVTPADWNPGEDVLLYHYKQTDLTDPQVNQITWFYTFKKMNSEISSK